MLKTDMLDIIFENRQKAYGAYDIRKTYPKNVRNALIAGALFFTVAISLPLIAKAVSGNLVKEEVAEVNLKKIAAPPPPPDVLPPPPPPPPPPPKEPPPPPKSTVEFKPPVVKPDVEVKKDPPKIEEFKDKDSGQKDQEGKKEGARQVDKPAEGKPAPPVVIEEKPKPVEDKIFTAVEIRAEFPGGDKALLQYLAEHIKYPAMARENNVEGKVFIQFVVGKDGSVSDVKVMRGIGAGCDEEAMRVVRELPRFKPARQNGQDVKMYYNLPVFFKLQE